MSPYFELKKVPMFPNNFFKESIMDLGAFSISLNVHDIEVSKAFYEKLGFRVFFGEITEKWLIMKNGDHTHWSVSGYV